MANASQINNTIEDIVAEVKKLDIIEQKAILAYIRAKRLKAEKKYSFS